MKVKTSDVLIETKKNLYRTLRRGKTRYVCFAIEYTGHIEGNKVIDRISKALGTSDSVRNWLISNGHATPEQCTYTNMQKYRHRWLDALIAEYKELGD